MATVAECEQALQALSARIAAAGGTGDASMRRSVSCRVKDLHVVFVGQLRGGALRDIALHDAAAAGSAGADIRLTTTSGDLVRLVDGSLGFAAAWGSGRLIVNASIMDLVRLRKLL